MDEPGRLIGFAVALLACSSDQSTSKPTAVGKLELLSGHNPDGLRFETERWIILRPQSPPASG